MYNLIFLNPLWSSFGYRKRFLAKGYEFCQAAYVLAQQEQSNAVALSKLLRWAVSTLPELLHAGKTILDQHIYFSWGLVFNTINLRPAYKQKDQLPCPEWLIMLNNHRGELRKTKVSRAGCSARRVRPVFSPPWAKGQRNHRSRDATCRNAGTPAPSRKRVAPT